MERNRKEMNNALMAPRKNKRSEASKAIAKAILEQYQPTSAEEMQDALRDIFGPMFEAMLQGEMDSHLGYESNDHSYKNTDNRRNGMTANALKTAVEYVSCDVHAGLFGRNAHTLRRDGKCGTAAYDLHRFSEPQAKFTDL